MHFFVLLSTKSWALSCSILMKKKILRWLNNTTGKEERYIYDLSILKHPLSSSDFQDTSTDLNSAPRLLLKDSFPSYNPSHALAVVDYQVSAELSTFVNPVPVFAFPSAHGIRFIFGSKGQERAKFQFCARLCWFRRAIFSHPHLLFAWASKLTVTQKHWLKIRKDNNNRQELTSWQVFSPPRSAAELTWRTWNKERTKVQSCTRRLLLDQRLFIRHKWEHSKLKKSSDALIFPITV